MTEGKAVRFPTPQPRSERGLARISPGRRERNKQEKLQRILEVAKELFGSKGFANTTTQEIAEKADIGAGTLFLYAKSKEELLVMVFSGDMLRQAQKSFMHLPASGSIVDKLMHVFGSMVEYHDRDRDLASVLLREITILTMPNSRKDMTILMRGIYSGIGDIIMAGQKAGIIRESVDPLLAAENLFGIYYLSLLNWMGGEMSKRAFLKRLRIKLNLGVEGMIDPAKTARPVPTQDPTREA